MADGPEKRAWLDYYERTLARPRYAEAGRLLVDGAKVYSQNDEDGIIQAIFERIGTTDRRFIEFGVQNGLECNTLLLLLTGWSGLWIEAAKHHRADIEERFDRFIEVGRLRCRNEFLTPANIDELLAPEGDEIDLLSIDIDYFDYWVWKALESVRPRVVVIEYNATLKPPLSLTVPYREGDRWDGTHFFGASLKALEKLGREKGYSLVGCCFSGVNAFFVRDDLVGDHFCAPFTAENHYEPPRYGMRYPTGHPAGYGIYEEI